MLNTLLVLLSICFCVFTNVRARSSFDNSSMLIVLNRQLNRHSFSNECHSEQSEESPFFLARDSSVAKLPQNDILRVIFYQYLIAGLIKTSAVSTME